MPIISSDHHRIYKNAATSPLLQLPSEVREKILIHLLGDNLIHVKYLSVPRLHRANRYRYHDESLASSNHEHPQMSYNNLDTDNDDDDDDDGPLEHGALLPPMERIREGALRHAICVANQSERSAYKKAISGSAIVPAHEKSDFYIPSCKERHADCKMCGSGPEYLLEQDRQALRVDLNVLGVCRQLYEEANHLLWATNTFSFEDPITCQKFFASLNPAQKRNLTNIHINATIGGHGSNYHSGANQRSRWDDEYWGKGLKIRNLNMLRGVRTLHLCVHQGFECVAGGRANNLSDAAAVAMVEKCQEADMEPILRLRALPVQDVTVIVSDDGEKWENLRYRWTTTKKNEYAKTIRVQLVDPRGAHLVETEAAIANLARKQENRDCAAARIETCRSNLKVKRERAIVDAKWARQAEASAELAAQKAKQVLKKSSKKAEKLRDIAERRKTRAMEARATADTAIKKEEYWRKKVADARQKYQRAMANLSEELGEDEVAQTDTSVHSGDDEPLLTYTEDEPLEEYEDEPSEECEDSS